MKRFKLLIIPILILILVTPVKALDIRSEENNFGVNKKEIKITANNKNNILATPLVDATEKVYDYAEILTDEEEEELRELILEYVNKTNMDMVILTDSKPYINDKENEDYAADFYDYNDFGLTFENYSGVLLYRNAYESDPYYNVYMFGEAQLYYDFNRSEAMLDDIYSNMVGHDYLEGFKQFIYDYTNYYERGIPDAMVDYKIDEMGFMYKVYRYPWGVALLLSGIVALIYALVFVHRNKMVKKAREAGDYLNKEDVHMNKIVDNFLHSRTTSYTVSSSSGGSGGGGSHSSSGSSGMGHSSGGGRHG